MDKISIAGLAAPFDQWGDPGPKGEPALRFRPGAIALSRPVGLRLWHDPTMDFANTSDDSLRIWADDRAVFFSADLSLDRKTVNVIRRIRSNDLRGVSVGLGDDTRVIDHPEGEEAVAGSLVEISLTNGPRQSGTAVWINDEPDDALPLAILAARQAWRASRSTPFSISARAVRPPASILAEIDRILAMPRPAGRR